MSQPSCARSGPALRFVVGTVNPHRVAAASRTPSFRTLVVRTRLVVQSCRALRSRRRFFADPGGVWRYPLGAAHRTRRRARPRTSRTRTRRLRAHRTSCVLRERTAGSRQARCEDCPQRPWHSRSDGGADLRSRRTRGNSDGRSLIQHSRGNGSSLSPPRHGDGFGGGVGRSRQLPHAAHLCGSIALARDYCACRAPLPADDECA